VDEQDHRADFIAEPSRGSRPRPAQHPRGSAGVVAELVAVVARALDREVAQHRLPLAPGPLTGHLAHADDAPLPPEADGAHAAVDERREHVHRVVVGFEHGWALAPLPAYCTNGQRDNPRARRGSSAAPPPAPEPPPRPPSPAPGTRRARARAPAPRR